MVIDWDELETQRLKEFRISAFNNLGKDYVPGEGSDNPTAFVLGEAPGAQEAAYRRPFVGPAGVVLRRLLSIGGLSEESCWITNTVKFRPPQNRKPTPSEIAAARPFLIREWHAVGAPRLIIAVGGVALNALLPRNRMPITKISGKCIQRNSVRLGPCYIWPMIHPSYGIRNPGMQPILEQDWERLCAWIEKNPRIGRRH